MPRRYLTKQLVAKAGILSHFHPPHIVAEICGITPYVAALIAKYRDRPFPKSILTLKAVAAIRTTRPATPTRTLAARFGITVQYVRKIRKGFIPKRLARQASTAASPLAGARGSFPGPSPRRPRSNRSPH